MLIQIQIYMPPLGCDELTLLDPVKHGAVYVDNYAHSSIILLPSVCEATLKDVEKKLTHSKPK